MSAERELAKNNRREEYRLKFIEFFSFSLFLLGLAGFIINLGFKSPINGICFLITHLLLVAFICSQLKMREHLRSLDIKNRSDAPVYLLIVQILLFFLSMGYLSCFFLTFCASESEFERTIASELVVKFRYISFGMLDHLLENKEGVNIRIYFSYLMLYASWFFFGLARLMDIVIGNTAIVYSLNGSKNLAVDSSTEDDSKEGLGK